MSDVKGDPQQEMRYAQVEAAYNRGMYAYCAFLARDFVHDHPEHGVGWALLGLAYIKLARYDDARRSLRLAVKHVAPEHLGLPYTWMGDLYSRKGDYKRAAHWYEKAIEVEPDHARGFLNLGLALSREGKLDDAEVAFREAIACERGDIAEAHLGLGLALRGLERYDEAIRHLEKADLLEGESIRARMAIEDVKLIERHKRLRVLRVIPGGDEE